MKIKINDQTHFTTFGAIAKGEIFVWDNSVLIKTEDTGYYGETYNAVDLEDGNHYSIDKLDAVIRPASYELSVNY